MVHDEQIRARNMLVEIDHPVLGKVEYPGNPCNFSESEGLCYGSAPTLGEHNEYVLKDILGMDDDAIDELKAKDIF